MYVQVHSTLRLLKIKNHNKRSRVQTKWDISIIKQSESMLILMYSRTTW